MDKESEFGQDTENFHVENPKTNYSHKAKAESLKSTEDPEEVARNLEQVRAKIRSDKISNGADITDLIESSRFPQTYKFSPIELSKEDSELISEIVQQTKAEIEKNYIPGFGISPSSRQDENYFEQIWTRDAGHAIGNYFTYTNPEAVKKSLETIFNNQREDGALPFRTEKRYALLQFIPKFGPYLAKKAFRVLRGEEQPERPRFEGEDFSGAEDTIPAIIIAAGEFFINSDVGEEFAKNNFDRFNSAMDFFRKKIDPTDGLAVTEHPNPDWEDSLYRKGKLGNINIFWARSLRLMEFMAQKLGRVEDTKKYRDEFRKTKSSVMQELYDKDGAYFRAKEGEDRLDTTASIFGALYLLGPEEAVRVEDSLEQRVLHSSGLQNFDPPYEQKDIFWVHRAINHQDYHNQSVWPWVTCENIQVKVKIALRHPDPIVRGKYQQQAVDDLLQVSALFKQAGGAYEIFKPDQPEPAESKVAGVTTYKPIQNFMGGLAAYQGAYMQLEKLGWIKTPTEKGQ
jgi:glycogen debranching enzyme